MIAQQLELTRKEAESLGILEECPFEGEYYLVWGQVYEIEEEDTITVTVEVTDHHV